jgi:hypothetical protein
MPIICRIFFVRHLRCTAAVQLVSQPLAGTSRLQSVTWQARRHNQHDSHWRVVWHRVLVRDGVAMQTVLQQGQLALTNLPAARAFMLHLGKKNLNVRPPVHGVHRVHRRPPHGVLGLAAGPGQLGSFAHTLTKVFFISQLAVLYRRGDRWPYGAVSPG